MKLIEVTANKGTYAAVRFDDKTVEALLKLIKDNNIPNGLPAEDFHSTICYSKKYIPDFKTLGDFSDHKWVGTPSRFGTFPTGDKACAILFYECPEQQKRFDFICKEYGATWDYDEYHCHVTLSYDIDDFDMKSLNIKKVKPLNIISEYTEELDLNKYNTTE